MVSECGLGAILMKSNTLVKFDGAVLTKTLVRGCAMIEVIPNRLYLAREDVFNKVDMKKISIVINLSSNPKLICPCGKYINLRWNIGDNVEEKMFEALVRFCAGAIKAPKQCLALIGHHDTVDVLAACVLRDYLGCATSIALGMMWEKRPKCLTKPGLVETVEQYKIS